MEEKWYGITCDKMKRKDKYSKEFEGEGADIYIYTWHPVNFFALHLIITILINQEIFLAVW